MIRNKVLNLSQTIKHVLNNITVYNCEIKKSDEMLRYFLLIVFITRTHPYLIVAPVSNTLCRLCAVTKQLPNVVHSCQTVLKL